MERITFPSYNGGDKRFKINKFAPTLAIHESLKLHKKNTEEEDNRNVMSLAGEGK